MKRSIQAPEWLNDHEVTTNLKRKLCCSSQTDVEGATLIIPPTENEDIATYAKRLKSDTILVDVPYSIISNDITEIRTELALVRRLSKSQYYLHVHSLIVDLVKCIAARNPRWRAPDSHSVTDLARWAGGLEKTKLEEAGLQPKYHKLLKDIGRTTLKRNEYAHSRPQELACLLMLSGQERKRAQLEPLFEFVYGKSMEQLSMEDDPERDSITDLIEDRF